MVDAPPGHRAVELAKESDKSCSFEYRGALLDEIREVMRPVGAIGECSLRHSARAKVCWSQDPGIELFLPAKEQLDLLG